MSADFGTLLSGSNVVTWEDRSGNGRHASQNTAGSRPMLVDNAVGGKPAIQFDGIDDNLIFDMPVNMLSGMTIAMVSANTLDGNGGSVGLEQPAIFWNETTSWGLVYLTPYQTNIVYRFGTTQTGNLGSYTRSVNVGNAFTQTMSIKDGTTDSLYVGGVLVDSAGGKLNQIAGCINTARIGSNGSSAFSGLIAEILVYTKALSQSERDALTSYFTARYPGGLVSGL